MGLTNAQLDAISVRDRTLLVSAAAGSGKTFTLTKRIIESIINDGQDLSRLLIVTFTKAAAAQLREKIAEAIAKAIEENQKEPPSQKQKDTQDHLQKQLIRLGSAHISTIDAFFMEPVRSNFEKLNLPASIRMADDAELLPIREKLMRDALDEIFDNYRTYESGELSSVGYSDRYTELIAIISETRDSSKLIPALCDIYSKLLTSSDGVEKLTKHAMRFAESADKPFFKTQEGELLQEHLCSVTDYAYKTMDKLYCDICADDAFTQKFIGLIEENANTCQSLAFKAQNGDIDDLIEAFADFSFGRLDAKGCAPCYMLEQVKTVRTSINDLLKDTRTKYLCATQDKISRDFRLYSEMALLLYDILSRFHKNYKMEKLGRGICEFSDMPIFMLDLLRDKDGKYTEYADHLANSFDAVYIDEYQDVNEIQNDIFTIIGRDHRFMVGDIKQSIYVFREAEPSIFNNYKTNFAEYKKGNPIPSEYDGNSIFMSENFRCDKTVVDFSNLVCSSLFTAFAKSINYTPQDNLNFAKEVPGDYKCSKVVLNLIQPSEDDGTQDYDSAQGRDDDGDDSNDAKNLSDEAIVVANEIARLIRSGEIGGAGDIKILARSNNHVKPLISALSHLNIKYALSSKTELFETAEMKLLIALLESIDNPHFDMPLCHIMTARADDFEPFFSFEDVLTIRKAASKSASLYDAVNAYAKRPNDDLADRCDNFVSLVNGMRIQAGKMAADKVIKNLSFSQNFYGVAQTTAYTYLYDCVCKYVKSNWNSLHSFLEYFKKLMESGSVGGEPAKSKNDAVTIMTIHQSKGLESKVVFLFGFGKRFNIKNKYNLVYDRLYGPTMKLPPDFADDCPTLERIKVKHEDTTIRQVFSFYTKNKQIEEEARILYVAMTRAKEKLYISATLNKSFNEYFESLKQCVDVNYQIKNSMLFIDWILLALPDAQMPNDLYQINVFDKGQTRLCAPFPKMRVANADIKIQDFEKKFAKLYNSPSKENPNDILLSMIPSKIAASKAVADMLDKSVFVPIPESRHASGNDEQAGEAGCDSEKTIRERIKLMRSQKTDFNSLLKAEQKPTAAERGTATHQFLQFCDYKRIAKDGVECEIEYLFQNKFIGERARSILDADKLTTFFESPFFKDVIDAQQVYPEFHFRMFRPASDFTLNDDVKRITSDKVILVQGSIDLVVQTRDGRLILCDYKTDRVSPELQADHEALVDEMRRRHGNQLEQYKYASEKIFGKAPDKIVLFLLSVGECVEL